MLALLVSFFILAELGDSLFLIPNLTLQEDANGLLLLMKWELLNDVVLEFKSET